MMIPLLEKARLLSLTETEREILDYLEKNITIVTYIGLSDLSAKLYTSNATIVRFCQKLGLKGYHEFKFQIRSELEQLSNPPLTAGRLLPLSAARFRDNAEAMDTEKLNQSAELLTSGRPVYIYGSSLSSIPAKYLQIVLTTLDYPSILIEWQRLLNGLIYGISGGSVLLAITAHGDAPRYLPVFKKAREQGILTILLTCDEDSPLIPYSTVSLCTNDENREYRHVDVNPRIGILTIIQILIDLAAQKRNREKTD